ncbi:MAG: aminotransferase class III-fold pyridoxal phosphate-dependent enzyme [Gemmatimonadetes bacterium]|nr:aminotransferase class III-fold pyridoxal phosphate-dependent enzyme [Gemmatimonadota bacterium]
MNPLAHARPRFPIEEAERIARERFGMRASARRLPGERDQNFELRAESGEPAVLKISQADEDPGLLECQNQIFDRLASAQRADASGRLAGFRFPQVVRSVRDQTIEPVDGERGVTHLTRLLRWVPGRPLATASPHDATLLYEVGRLIGAIGAALDGYDHPAAHRSLHWDLQRFRAVIDQHIGRVANPQRSALLRSFLPVLDAAAADFARLRRSVIHGDANDWNVLVDGPPADDPFAGIHASGIVDFGDLVHSWTLGDLAIACAYAMLEKRDPLAAALRVVAGCHDVAPLPESEVRCLFPLICARLCTSVVLSAWQRGLQPDDEYLSVSEAPAWALLDRLATLHPRFAHYAFRDACGLPASPTAPRVSAWIEASRERFGHVLGAGPDAGRASSFDELVPVTLDMSIATPAFPETAGPCDLARWTIGIARVLRESGTRCAIGRYDEARPWYLGDAFLIETDEAPEGRTVHIGIDLFAEPGTPVFAPLDGVIHAFADNAVPLDYGPTLVLRHQTDDRTPFWTLWGHLSRDSVDALEMGARISKGQRIGRIGDDSVNGGWVPHTHLQLITDLLDNDAGFPGIARPSQRSIWQSICPDPGALAGVPAACAAADTAGAPVTRDGQAGARAEDAEPADRLLRRRASVLSAALSVAYRRPLIIVRGWRQHLYDEAGQSYLDAVNNVAHVGHAHPRVVEAIHRQAAVLNTNTRYLHHAILDYAQRLAATLPDPLCVCFLVCSGSEANELALRLAHAHTGRRDVLVLDAGYHGNTTSLVDISPYKFRGPGGQGPPAHVHVAPLPDPYRGRYRGPDAGDGYLGDLRVLLTELVSRDALPGAFFAEPLPGCGGQIVPPAGFLAGAFRLVRENGGVCIADEVQTGLGRVGSRFWAFELDGALPDIVTVGKPIGNGHPLGAVITTREIADSFANGMEYFNTFGGNPVSVAAGAAVLDVIAEEGLQQNAQQIGAHLLEGLRALMDRHERIGDVRGAGLYIGVELVLDRGARTPAGAHASYVANRMREHGILLSTDGPDHNVLKIKPPLVFTAPDADRLIATLDRVLGEDAVRAAANRSAAR